MTVASAIAARRTGIPVALATIVFVIAFAMRLPSCFESFWLDELHSAWTVWGSFADVATRAAAGNQTPPYFWMLWSWKQCVGDAEWALRLPGVIAISFAAAMLTLGVHRVRGSLLGGFVAGLVLAVESNSLFYGTELRPFAAIILLATGVCWFAMKPTASNAQDHLALVAITIPAATLQPTSIAVLGWLWVARFSLAALQARAFRERVSSESGTLPPQQPRTRGLARVTALGLAVIAFALVAVWLGGDVMQHAWKHRSQWQPMGRADSLQQLWRAWPWGSLVVLPVILSTIIKAGTYFIKRQRADAGTTPSSSTELLSGTMPSSSTAPYSSTAPLAGTMPEWVLIATVFAAVFLFWSVSALGIAPVFHRRYFVACLPLLAWLTGDWVSLAIKQLSGLKLQQTSHRIISLWITILPIGVLMLSQGTAKKLMQQESRLVRRGEGWREAVGDLHRRHDLTTRVLLSPGLVETARLLDTNTDQEQDHFAQWYLTYPLQGPYLWPNVQAFDLAANSRHDEFPALIRGGRDVVENWIARTVDSDRKSLRVRSFGGIQLVERLAPSLPMQ